MTSDPPSIESEGFDLRKIPFAYATKTRTNYDEI